MTKLKHLLIAVFGIITLVSFSEAKSEASSTAGGKKIIKRDINPRLYSQGQRLYQLNCATCHGRQAEGARDWRTPDAQGKYPPPPLNGTGHTWHHSSKALKFVIMNGTAKIGGNMPAWKDKLTMQEIELILTWITAQWSDEIYTAWYTQHHQKK